MEAYKLDQYFEFTFTTANPSTGAAADADSLPTFRVYEENNETAVATGNCAKRDDANTLGYYYARAQMTTAAGFEVGKVYEVKVDATVASVAGSQVVGRFRVWPDTVYNALIAGTGNLTTTPDDKTGYSLSTAGIKAIWDQLMSVTFAVGSFGEKLKNWVLGTDNRVEVSGTRTKLDTLYDDVGEVLVNLHDSLKGDTEDIQARLPVALIDGKMSATVDTPAQPTPAEIASEVVAEITTGDPPTMQLIVEAGLTSYGAATGDNVTTARDGILDILGTPAGDTLSADVAEVKSDTGAIKSKTDPLTYTVPNKPDVNADVVLSAENIQDIADAVNAGAGTGAHDWRVTIRDDAGNAVARAAVRVFIADAQIYIGRTDDAGDVVFRTDLSEGTTTTIKISAPGRAEYTTTEDVTWET